MALAKGVSERGYKVLKKLGKGAQGAVWLVHHESDPPDVHQVLKKVECNDEAEAAKAFQEAMALENLKHKYICGYKEFFCYWDKEDETMYVCIVMNFYPTGDLETVLKQQRTKETPLPEPIVKRWFGQMIEAMHFVHEQKVIHRDLKPTNIFMTKELDVAVGDFGVATVMNDARTRTRTTVGTMTWMAPEVLERPYDERSDVWSLGCILLDAASCGFADTKQSQQALFEIKTNSSKLTDVLTAVGLSYSKELCGVIQQMLRREFQHRPSINDLIQIPYVRSCLALSKSTLVEGDTKKAYTAVSVKPKTTKRIPEAVPDIIKFLEDQSSRVACMVAGLEQLTKKLVAAPPLDEAGKRRVAITMVEHDGNVWVQIAAMEALSEIIKKAPTGDNVYSKHYINPISEALRKHQGSVELQKAALTVYDQMADLGGVLIGECGGIQDTLAALRMFKDKTDLVELCCSALYHLALHERNVKFVIAEDGDNEVINALAEHGINDEGDPPVVSASIASSACGLLWTLTAGLEDASDPDAADAQIDKLADSGCIGMIAKAIALHKNDTHVVREACLFLSGIVYDEDCGIAVYSNDEEIDGIVAITEAFKHHLDSGDEETVLQLCSVLGNLAQHEDLREILVDKSSTELLTMAKMKYEKGKTATAMKIHECCNKALDILGGTDE